MVDVIGAVNEVVNKNPLVQAANATASNLVNGFFGSGQLGTHRREIIRWQVPSKSYSVEMYINPQNISIASSKITNEIRTKGGFIVQYWGEDFDRASITGTTGSGGIEGINILKDVYRDEQLVQQSELQSIVTAVQNLNTTQLLNVAGLDASSLLSVVAGTSNQKKPPLRSLAARAMNVRMLYQGITYRGFFKGINVTESADQLGLFNYDMQFTIVETIGKRNNFMPWHRNPNTPAKGSLSYDNVTNSPETLIDQKMTQFVKDTRLTQPKRF